MGENWKDRFREPPEEFSVIPFWFWNGTLEPGELKRQMGMMKEQGIYGAFMHARAYITTPYLEKEWWEAISACVEEGRGSVFIPGCTMNMRGPAGQREVPSNMDFSTHEEYAARYGKHFGGKIPGIFFDEIYMAARGLAWTEKLPETFRERHHYDLLENLPWLLQEGSSRGDKVREDYFETAAHMYETAFFKQTGDWCREHHLMLTGHTEEYLSMHSWRQGDYFRTMRHLQIPGADCHDYRYRLPRKISFHEPKYSVSVARAYGRERAMSEAMGGAGWGCSLQEYRRGVHTMGAMGINFFVLHGMYYECDHQGSQADWPASFFYQNPYWKYFRHLADEIRRICYMNSLGNPVVQIGLYYPIRDIQRHTIGIESDWTARHIEEGYNQALYSLVENQMDADVIDEDTILAAPVREGYLESGGRKIQVLLFPQEAVLTAELKTWLNRYQISGGKVLFYGEELPSCKLPEKIAGLIGRDVEILKGDSSEIYVNHRKIENCDSYFISNSEDVEKTLQLRLNAMGRVSRMDSATGKIWPVSARCVDGKVQVEIMLAADEACYLLVEPLKGEEPVETWGKRLGYGQEAKPIRICNTRWEMGRCGRHLSLWKASWITRRPHWQDSMDQADLYFQKEVFLESDVSGGRICVAAVQQFTLYVNGHLAGEGGMKPVTLELGDFFHQGENLIAVHVHNPNPYPDSNICSVEKLPADRMISLLLEGELYLKDIRENPVCIQSNSEWIVSNQYEESWENLSRRLQAHRHDPARQLWAERDGVWLYAWERGNVPLQPWGDLPLYGERLSWPRRVAYQITLPVGTAEIAAPCVKGGYRCRLDGVEVSFAEEKALRVRPIDRVRMLELDVEAESPEDGLQQPLQVLLKPVPISYREWASLGLPWFSGQALYRNRFWWKPDVFREEGQELRYILQWGQRESCAEVWINHQLAAVTPWAPYRADITEFLQEGENEITIIVSNSAAPARRHMLVDEGMALGWNRYWNEDNIDRESEDLVSGLMGPVRIYRQQRDFRLDAP